MRVVMQLLYYPLAVVLALGLVLGARSVADLHRAVAVQQGPEMSTERELKMFAEQLTFGLYEGGTAASAEFGALLAAAEQQASRARHSAWALAAVSGLFLVPSLIGWRHRNSEATRRLARDLLGVSAVFLVVGVLAPVLSVAVHKELPVLGDVVLQHDTKSIVGTIFRLYQLGSWFTAVMLVTFSVLMPFIKLLLAWVASASGVAARRRVLSVIDHIGKWSMTDVFVVAVLLAFLASGPDGLTRASLGVGLYFFAGYAIASQVAGHLLVHSAPPLPARLGTGEQTT